MIVINFIINAFLQLRNFQNVVINYVFSTASSAGLYSITNIIFQDTSHRNIAIPFALIQAPFIAIFFICAIIENLTADKANKVLGKNRPNGWNTVMKIAAVLIISTILSIMAVICEVGNFGVTYWIINWIQIACFGLFFAEIFKEIERNIKICTGEGIPALRKIASFMDIISTKSILSKFNSLNSGDEKIKSDEVENENKY